MKLHLRRLVYSIFIGAFLIITPILITYASGYRYNFKKNKIEKTGILYVDSNPKQSLIYIDGKYENKTPAKFSYMLPDIYKIKVEKEGYYPWEKEIEIKSNLTTFSKNIILFKKSLPINIINGEINILDVSLDKTKIIYSLIFENGEELRLLNLRNESDFKIEKFNLGSYSNIDFVQWSPNGNKAIIKKQIGDFNKYLIIDIETLKIKELFDITRLNFSELKWDIKNENYLYGLRNSVLYQIDIATNSVKPIISDKIQDFQINDGKIFYLSTTEGKSFINKIEIGLLMDGKVKKIKLPSTQYRLYPKSHDYLILIDKNNNDFFILNSNVFNEDDISKSIILQDKAKEVIWSDNAKKILYYSDFEISTFNFENGQKDLVTRYSEVISQAIWHPENKYIIYKAENKIKVIEADEQKYKNDIQLAELQKISQIILDDQGNNIYFNGRAGTQQGIYKLEIQ